jgi:glycerol uptake facilitator-like aquaporin
LFALIATGLTFYVITFIAMYAALRSGQLNPAVTPGVTWSLRDLGVPLSVAIGVTVFAVTMWRSRHSRGSE